LFMRFSRVLALSLQIAAHLWRFQRTPPRIDSFVGSLVGWLINGEAHANRVFYKDQPTPGHRFRQVVVIEVSPDVFELRVFEGDVAQRTAPRLW